MLPAESIEPRVEELAGKYNLIEFNTSMKPRVFEYLFLERQAEAVLFLDPDMRAYAAWPALDEVLKHANVVLTPHILTPVPLDGKSPNENVFLNYGIYNLGFIAARSNGETREMMRWWKDRTYVHVLRHPGYNMAPWNLHERVLSRGADGSFLVNARSPLVLFHFSGFRVDSGELPEDRYNRFSMIDRPDLADLYDQYDAELKSAGHARYANIGWAFAAGHEPSAWAELRRDGRSLARRGLLWALRRLPPSVTERAHRMLGQARSLQE